MPPQPIRRNPRPPAAGSGGQRGGSRCRAHARRATDQAAGLARRAWRSWSNGSRAGRASRPPRSTIPMVAIFAANHGVTDQGVSAFPREVTAQMVANFTAGGAAISQICALHELNLRVFELALELPTGDITLAPAMDDKMCAATIAYGMEAIAGKPDCLAIGEMGIGNTTIAAAIYAALYGGTGADWVGRGTGVDDAGLRRKADAVDRALAFHRDGADRSARDPRPPRRPRDRGDARRAHRRAPPEDPGDRRWLRRHGGRGHRACGQPRRDRPLHLRPRLGRDAHTQGPRADGRDAAARSRHATGGGERRGARHGAG